METCGRVLHPAVSSVVYLSDEGDPTIVLDETLDRPLGASRARLVHPRARAFLAFDGDLLHGVLPGPFAPASRAAAAGDAPVGNGGAPAQRLTLLIAWYAEHTRAAAKRVRLGAQAAVPRPSRSQTWPRDLELRPDEHAMDHGDAWSRLPARAPVPTASPVWAPVPRRDAGRGRHGASLDAPTAVRQHFFMRSATEVGDRLREEHGIGGSWAAGKAKGTKRSR